MSNASDQNIQWMYENDDGTGYNLYNQDVSNILDYIYIQRNIFWGGATWTTPNPLRSEFIIPSYLPSERFRFLFNFDTMEQTNLNSGNYKSLDPSTKRLATRGIIRLMNDRVWVQYLNDGRFDFKYVDDISTVHALNMYTTDSTRGNATISPYTSKNLDRQISFDELINKGKYMYQCNSGTVIVQGCTVQELLQLKQQRFKGKSLPVAPPPPPQAPSASYGENYFLIPGTNYQTAIYSGTNGPDFFVYGDVTHYIDPQDRRKAYHYDVQKGQNVWSFQGGSSSKTGNKNKRLSKRNKTYKKKKYNKRKTIKR